MTLYHIHEDEALSSMMTGLMSGTCQVDKLSDEAVVKVGPSFSLFLPPLHVSVSLQSTLWPCQPAQQGALFSEAAFSWMWVV